MAPARIRASEGCTVGAAGPHGLRRNVAHYCLGSSEIDCIADGEKLCARINRNAAKCDTAGATEIAGHGKILIG